MIITITFVLYVGVFQQTYITTEDGLESTFAINVAATYILMCMLYPLLKKSRQSIILNVSSGSQYDLGRIELDNLQFERGESWHQCVDGWTNTYISD